MSVGEKRPAADVVSADSKRLQKGKPEVRETIVLDGDGGGNSNSNSNSKEDESIIGYREDGNYTYSEWPGVLEKTMREGDAIKIEKMYTQYLEQYVNDGDRWSEYIGWLMRGNGDGDVNKLDKKKIEGYFFKVLTKVYNVGLWRLYLKYVEMNNNVIKVDDAERARSVVLKAYKFALDNVGIDFFEGHLLWGDYLRYLYLWQTTTPTEANTREDFIRKALKSMISQPGIHLEENWRIFTKFESDLNMNKSRKIITEITPEYLKMKQFNDELIEITKGISKIKNRKFSERQDKRWEEWILWEESNRMGLPEEDVLKRVGYVYRKYVEICQVITCSWFNYGRYLMKERGDKKGCIEILKEGLTVNPCSLILTDELSSLYEIDALADEMKVVWKNLIASVEASNEVEVEIEGKKREIISECYTIFMRAMKRASTMQDVRLVFKLARQYKGIDWSIYREYAEMEMDNKEEKIANRAFALGMQTFKSNLSFVMAYLQFLLARRDLSAVEKVLETSVENFTELKDEGAVKVLLGEHLRVEQRWGDVTGVRRVQERYEALFGRRAALRWTAASAGAAAVLE